MKKQAELAFVAICVLSVFPAFGSWVETFDSGVGRLNQTTGPGDTCFVWDSSNQAILGHFYRAHTYKRFALLEKTVNPKDAVMGFSAVVTPLYNGKPTDMNPGAAVGFMDSSDADSDNRYTVVFLGKTSVIVSAIPGHGGEEIPYSVNHTYFVDVFLNGPGNYFSIDIFEGTDRNGIFQGNITTPIREYGDLNALGMANGLNASGLIYGMDMRINEISYIEPTLVVKSPNGNESYLAETTQDITWSSEVVGNQVLLQYSTDNGSSWNDIATVSNTGTYPWLIPDINSNTCLVKISSVDYPSIFDVSDAPFAIVGYEWFVNPANGHRYALTLNYGPWLACEAEAVAQGGHLVTINDPAELEWLLDPSRPLCLSDMACCPGYAGGNGSWIGMYYDGIGYKYSLSSWKWLTGEVGSDFLIPIYGPGPEDGIHMILLGPLHVENHGKIVNISGHDINPDAYLKGIIEVVDLSLKTPNGGEILPATVTTEIKWESSGEINQVLLEYSTNNGTDWTNINTVANTGSYPWQVPDLASDQCLIRISEAGDPGIFDVSDSAFSIRKHEWYSYNGHQYALTFKQSNWLDAQAEAVSVGGYLVVINSVEERDWLLDTESNPFGTVYMPCCPGDPAQNGIWIGLRYTTGELHSQDSWEWVNGDPITYWNVAGSFYGYEGIHMAMTGALRSDSGQFANGPHADNNPPNYLYGVIEYVPKITILTPKPDGYVSNRSPFTILWEMETKFPVLQVKIELSVDNGTNWQTIDQVDNTGSYPWSVPDIFSTTCLVKISSVDDPQICDISDGPFSIGPYSGGSGTADDLYKISTVADWQRLMNSSADWDKSFILMNDLDLADVALIPIAPDTDNTEENGYQGTPFSGAFDGDGHVIRNVVINLPSNDFVSLFGLIATGGQIRNLGIQNVNITGRNLVGGLCGSNGGFGNTGGWIISCNATGTVSGTGSAVGGLCGGNYIHVEGGITKCFAAVTVSGTRGLGGLVGVNDHGAITSSYATGSVGGPAHSEVGGLCGVNRGTISQSYATGAVTGGGELGGLCGQNTGGATITNSYSTGRVNGVGGGLCGRLDVGTISNSFWDIQTSGKTTSYGGTGKTTAEMKTVSTFTGWDFVNTWWMPSGSYPRLAWELGFCRLRPSAPPIRISRSVFEYQYQVEVSLQDAVVDLDGYTVEVASNAPGLTVVNGTVCGLSIGDDGKVVSNDFVTLRIDRKIFSPPAQLTWKMTYDPPQNLPPPPMAMGFFSIGVAGDYDGNGKVDLLDVIDLSLHWLQTDSPYDVSGDGFVNMEDFAILSGSYQP